MIQQTSLEAYLYDVKPKLGAHHKRVLGALGTRDNFTIKELAKYLGWDSNQVTGRLDELLKCGEIEVIGGRLTPEKRRCKITNKNAMQWRIRTANSPLTN